MKKLQQGFTLIELMIVVAIIGILASVAVPQYQNFILKADYKEVVTATGPFKLATEMCYQELGSLATCDSGITAGLSYDGKLAQMPATAGASGVVTSVTAVNGVITAVSTLANSAGTAAADYIMTPGIGEATRITWAITGSCTIAPAIC